MAAERRSCMVYGLEVFPLGRIARKMNRHRNEAKGYDAQVLFSIAKVPGIMRSL